MSNHSTMSPNDVVLSEEEWASATSLNSNLHSNDVGKEVVVHCDSDSSDSDSTEVTSNMPKKTTGPIVPGSINSSISSKIRIEVAVMEKVVECKHW